MTKFSVGFHNSRSFLDTCAEIPLVFTDTYGFYIAIQLLWKLYGLEREQPMIPVIVQCFRVCF